MTEARPNARGQGTATGLWPGLGGGRATRPWIEPWGSSLAWGRAMGATAWPGWGRATGTLAWPGWGCATGMWIKPRGSGLPHSPRQRLLLGDAGFGPTAEHWGRAGSAWGRGRRLGQFPQPLRLPAPPPLLAWRGEAGWWGAVGGVQPARPREGDPHPPVPWACPIRALASPGVASPLPRAIQGQQTAPWPGTETPPLQWDPPLA